MRKKTSYRGQILSRLFLAKYDRRVGFDIINYCSISVNPIRLFFVGTDPIWEWLTENPDHRAGTKCGVGETGQTIPHSITILQTK